MPIHSQIQNVFKLCNYSNKCEYYEWLELLKSQEDDQQKIKAIENARVLIETGLEK